MPKCISIVIVTDKRRGKLLLFAKHGFIDRENNSAAFADELFLFFWSIAVLKSDQYCSLPCIR